MRYLLLRPWFSFLHGCKFAMKPAFSIAVITVLGVTLGGSIILAALVRLFADSFPPLLANLSIAVSLTAGTLFTLIYFAIEALHSYDKKKRNALYIVMREQEPALYSMWWRLPVSISRKTYLYAANIAPSEAFRRDVISLSNEDLAIQAALCGNAPHLAHSR